MTDWGIIVADVQGLLERHPEMRVVEDKVWDYLLRRVHTIHSQHSEAAYANTRNLLCEYLSDHLGKQANPCSKATPADYKDWLWVITEILGFIRDNPALKQVEPELWEWMLNRTYPLTPNHAPTAKAMTAVILGQCVGEYGPTAQLVAGLKQEEPKPLPPGLVEMPEPEQQQAEPEPETLKVANKKHSRRS